MTSPKVINGVLFCCHPTRQVSLWFADFAGVRFREDLRGRLRFASAVAELEFARAMSLGA